MYLLHSEIVHEALKTESNTLLLIYSSLLTVPRRRKEKKCRSHEWNSLIISYSLYTDNRARVCVIQQTQSKNLPFSISTSICFKSRYVIYI